MNTLLNRLHARIGDLWWYSAMIFVACRSGDVIQAFIGLWLVPKYVGPEELGAVLPLQQLTSFLTIPIAIIAIVFSKYVNKYATRGEFGKVKCFIHDVFTASIILFFICIAGANLIMPFFYERLRISAGSLTLLILLCGLVTNIGSIIYSAQQGLKRFKTMSLMAIISAPIRLITLIVTMPFRAISGYILGQTTPGATTTILSIFDIHKFLKPYSPDKSWRKDIPEIWRHLWPYAICTFVGGLAGAITATIYRQRLPEDDSAAYYLLTRFSDIAAFAGVSLSTILFPLASEAHEKGNENTKILWHTIIGAFSICTVLALLFYAISDPILSLTEVWRPYKEYAYLLPILTLNVGPGIAIGAITSYEFACQRIGSTVIMVFLNLIFATFLCCFAGHGFFSNILPGRITEFMSSLHIDNLQTITYYTIIFNFCEFFIIILYAKFSKQKNKPHNKIAYLHNLNK